MLQADINEKSSIESALQGAHAVFAVTNFWEKLSYDVEVQQGKNIADAAKAAGVQHLVWSSLFDVTKREFSPMMKYNHQNPP